MLKTLRVILLTFLILNIVACSTPSGKSENAMSTPATILGPADEPASAPSSIKVQGKFTTRGEEKTGQDDLCSLIISKVVSVSSSLTQNVGIGDTLSVLISTGKRINTHGEGIDRTNVYQLILQEKLMMGHEGVIYSVKDIQRLLHSK